MSQFEWYDLISVIIRFVWLVCGKQVLGDKGDSRGIGEVVIVSIQVRDGGERMGGGLRLRVGLDYLEFMCELEKSNFLGKMQFCCFLVQ